MDMNMPMPSASPSASPMGQMPGKDMSGMNMNMGPLMVMKGNDMGIRVGASDTNIMSMGAMGSGTTWQPSSGPMHMLHKQSGDWLLMFHYNFVDVAHSEVAGKDALAPGKHIIKMDFTYDGGGRAKPRARPSPWVQAAPRRQSPQRPSAIPG